MREVESESLPVNGILVKRPSTDPLPRGWVAAVCSLTFLAYAPTLRFQFVHDDRGVIVGNPAVHSWHFVPSYFTSHIWAAVSPTTIGNEYRPLFLLWLRFNDALFGQHTAGWHFTSVVAHVVATYCVILLAHRVFQERAVALFSGIIFGLHPVHIEGVAWISSVPEPLVAALSVPAYLCWVRSREAGDRRGRWLAASLTLYAMALFTKETAIVLPLILFVSQWLDFPCPFESRPRGWVHKFWNTLKALAPFVAVAVAYLMVRMVALKGFAHPITRISWLTVALTWPSLLLFYLKLLVWPVVLPFYGLRFVTHPTFWNVILPGLTLLLVALGVRTWAARARPVALTIPWLVVPILPVLNIQMLGNANFAHNRYLYLPSVGFSMLVAAALSRIKGRSSLVGGIPHVQLGACLALGLAFTFAIQVEDRYYSSDAAFYSFAFAHADDAVIAMDYANTLAEQGDSAHASNIYRRLIQAHPDMWNAYFNYGYMLYRLGDLDPAVFYLSRTAGGDPRNAGAIFYLGLADFKLNRLGEAEAALRRAIALAPNAPDYHFALGMVLRVRGDSSGAMAEFSTELALHPGSQAAAQQVADIKERDTKTR
jgi:hypothetical protein